MKNFFFFLENYWSRTGCVQTIKISELAEWFWLTGLCWSNWIDPSSSYSQSETKYRISNLPLSLILIGQSLKNMSLEGYLDSKQCSQHDVSWKYRKTKSICIISLINFSILNKQFETLWFYLGWFSALTHHYTSSPFCLIRDLMSEATVKHNSVKLSSERGPRWSTADGCW